MLTFATIWPYFLACCRLMNVYSRVLAAVETASPSRGGGGGGGRPVFTWDI